MALLAPVLSSLPGIVEGIGSIMDYNKRYRAAGSGLSARGYTIRQRMGQGLLYAGKRGGKIRYKKRAVRHRGGKIHKKRRMVRRAGKGFAADFMSNIPLIGPLLGSVGRAIGLGMVQKKRRPKKYARSNLPALMLRGKGLSPMYPATMRRRLGSGLLAPAGGKMRRAHYRYVKSAKGGAVKRVHVRRHKVRRGGYVPLTWRC